MKSVSKKADLEILEYRLRTFTVRTYLPKHPLYKSLSDQLIKTPLLYTLDQE
jgi:hypothetical protein